MSAFEKFQKKVKQNKKNDLMNIPLEQLTREIILKTDATRVLLFWAKKLRVNPQGLSTRQLQDAIASEAEHRKVRQFAYEEKKVFERSLNILPESKEVPFSEKAPSRGRIRSPIKDFDNLDERAEELFLHEADLDEEEEEEKEDKTQYLRDFQLTDEKWKDLGFNDVNAYEQFRNIISFLRAFLRGDVKDVIPGDYTEKFLLAWNVLSENDRAIFVRLFFDLATIQDNPLNMIYKFIRDRQNEIKSSVENNIVEYLQCYLAIIRSKFYLSVAKAIRREFTPKEEKEVRQFFEQILMALKIQQKNPQFEEKVINQLINNINKAISKNKPLAEEEQKKLNILLPVEVQEQNLSYIYHLLSLLLIVKNSEEMSKDNPANIKELERILNTSQFEEKLGQYEYIRKPVRLKQIFSSSSENVRDYVLNLIYFLEGQKKEQRFNQLRKIPQVTNFEQIFITVFPKEKQSDKLTQYQEKYGILPLPYTQIEFANAYIRGAYNLKGIDALYTFLQSKGYIEEKEKLPIRLLDQTGEKNPYLTFKPRILPARKVDLMRIKKCSVSLKKQIAFKILHPLQSSNVFPEWEEQNLGGYYTPTSQFLELLCDYTWNVPKADEGKVELTLAKNKVPALLRSDQELITITIEVVGVNKNSFRFLSGLEINDLFRKASEEFSIPKVDPQILLKTPVTMMNQEYPQRLLLLTDRYSEISTQLIKEIYELFFIEHRTLPLQEFYLKGLLCFAPWLPYFQRFEWKTQKLQEGTLIQFKGKFALKDFSIRSELETLCTQSKVSKAFLDKFHPPGYLYIPEITLPRQEAINFMDVVEGLAKPLLYHPKYWILTQLEKKRITAKGYYQMSLEQKLPEEKNIVQLKQAIVMYLRDFSNNVLVRQVVPPLLAFREKAGEFQDTGVKESNYLAAMVNFEDICPVSLGEKENYVLLTNNGVTDCYQIDELLRQFEQQNFLDKQGLPFSQEIIDQVITRYLPTKKKKVDPQLEAKVEILKAAIRDNPADTPEKLYTLFNEFNSFFELKGLYLNPKQVVEKLAFSVTNETHVCAQCQKFLTEESVTSLIASEQKEVFVAKFCEMNCLNNFTFENRVALEEIESK